MPEEELWRTFFDPPAILDAFGMRDLAGDVVDFGSGFGTFTVEAARRTSGRVIALEMVRRSEAACREAGLTNAEVLRRDFLAEGTGLSDAVADFAMLFNILHTENPMGLLREAWRILRPGGRVAIMHWVCDRPTPRGPSMDIRPTSTQCQQWAQLAGFETTGAVIDLPPYHYGILCRRS